MAELIHGTALACGERAVLLRGPPGSGKSDLALRCVGLAHTLPLPGPVLLVADDQVLAEPAGDHILLRQPAQIAGLIEVRGVGIVRVDHRPSAQLAIVIDLVSLPEVERLPEDGLTTSIAGCHVPLYRLYAFEPSAPLKVLLALSQTPALPASIGA